MDTQYQASRVGLQMDGTFGNLKVTDLTIQVTVEEFRRLEAMSSPRQILVRYNDPMGYECLDLMDGFPSVAQITVNGGTIFELTWEV